MGRREDGRRDVGRTVRDLGRAVAGGLLVGLPLLWTMEMWEYGAILPPLKLLALLAAGTVIVFGYTALGGFRRERSHPEMLVDVAQGVGLSVLVAAGALVLLGRLEPGTGLGVAVGQVALLAIPVAFGTSLAATVLSESSDADEGRAPVGPIGRLTVAAGGALYFALNIAPTEEVRIVGTAVPPLLQLVAVGVSLLVGYGVVHHLEFRGGGSRAGNGPLDTAAGETIAAYAIALAVALLMTWAFGLTDGLGVGAIVGQVVMLGVVASFGAAGGRLLVGGGAGGAKG